MTGTVDLTGAHVVVTGGASGIGAALAHEAASRGAARISLLDVDIETATATADEIDASTAAGAQAYACDVSTAADVDALAAHLVDEHGLPALVCANAGVTGPTAPLLDTGADVAAWILGVNTLGVLHTLQSFGRRMVAAGAGGWLLVTASEHAVGVPHLNAGVYTASKHAVLGLCDVLRRELPDHVGLSVLCPGLTVSRLWQASELRPERFGGPIDADRSAGAFMEHAGMPATTVAERALDGVAAGHFLIPTHYNARAYAAQRSEETAEAFERLSAIDTTDYDVVRLVTDLLGGGADPGSDSGSAPGSDSDPDTDTGDS